MTFRVDTLGLDKALKSMRRIPELERKASLAALAKTMKALRGMVRREISRRLEIPLKLTSKRVGWFWKRGRRRRGEPEAKLWVGTRYPVRSNELPRLKREPRGSRVINLTEAARSAVNRTAVQAFGKRFPRELKSQQARFLTRA